MYTEGEAKEIIKGEIIRLLIDALQQKSTMLGDNFSSYSYIVEENNLITKMLCLPRISELSYTQENLNDAEANDIHAVNADFVKACVLGLLGENRLVRVSPPFRGPTVLSWLRIHDDYFSTLSQMGAFSESPAHPRINVENPKRQPLYAKPKRRVMPYTKKISVKPKRQPKPEPDKKGVFIPNYAGEHTGIIRSLAPPTAKGVINKTEPSYTKFNNLLKKDKKNPSSPTLSSITQRYPLPLTSITIIVPKLPTNTSTQEQFSQSTRDLSPKTRTSPRLATASTKHSIFTPAKAPKGNQMKESQPSSFNNRY